jgi:DNA-binding response OmpR family regulator
MPMKILIVDDDRSILEMIKRYLTANGVSVVMTDNGSEALLLVKDSRPDLVLCDAQMPGLDGHALCRALKREAKTSAIPVVLMSGEKMGDKDVVSGLELGADDYILKPFAMSVLLARLKAVLRRNEAGSSSSEAVNKSGIELEPEGRTVKVGGKTVALTGKEFDLLAVLISKSGRLLSVTYLLETVWGYDPANYNDPGTVEVHVSHLRKKLGPRHARHIVNVPGHGYKFDPAPEAHPR